MDKDNSDQPAHQQKDAPADAPPVDVANNEPFIMDLDNWVLTPAQRAFIKSLHSDDDDESDTDR